MPDGLQFIGAGVRAEAAVVDINTGAVIGAASCGRVYCQPIGAGNIDNRFLCLALRINPALDYLHPLQRGINGIACCPDKKAGECC